jgi:preprotein translocase subunit Sec61beta
MKGIRTEDPVTTPMSSAGIMRFFDVSGGGPKISPMVVVGAAIAILALELIIGAIF